MDACGLKQIKLINWLTDFYLSSRIEEWTVLVSADRTDYMKLRATAIFCKSSRVYNIVMINTIETSLYSNNNAQRIASSH